MVDDNGREPCWFCGQREAETDAARTVKLLRSSGGTDSHFFIEKTTVPVPRCSPCKAGHDRVMTICGLTMVVGALAVLAFFMTRDTDAPWWFIGIVMLIVGAGPGTLLFHNHVGLPAGQKPDATAITHPVVMEALARGWMVDGPEGNA